MPVRPVIPNTAARRLFLQRHGLTVAPTGLAKGAALAQVITDLGFVQLDSVNTLARAHDLILWSRRGQFRPAALQDLLHRDRAVFEHWTHDASVIPIGHFPHWQHRFARSKLRIDKWRSWQGSAFEDRFDSVLDRIASQGEVMSADLAPELVPGEARGKTGWWDWHPSKTALEYLWHTGAISVVRRDGFRKVYDLTERVIPAALLNQRRDTVETVDWAARQALDRLGFATPGEVAAFLDLITPGEARDWCRAALASGEVIPVDVENVDGSLRQALARPALLDAVPPEVTDRVRILTPFDPALRDRKRAERLFGFHFRIEIFVPAPQRRYGYYVFPVLEGDRLIGRIDMKADRGAGALLVQAFWPEIGVTMGKGRIARLRTELERVAVFTDLTRIDEAPGWVRG